MEGNRSLLARVRIPTRIIVHRSAMDANSLARVIRNGDLAPAGVQICELEAGGKVIARGRIVRRRGEYCFKVLETAKEETA